ncbi:hypothetical protein EDM02_01975 [Candidatus Cardinium hertigii]|jgi:hypothetical protein|uniref:Secreted protein n=1 Tax=Candidatus Cardinium hertigii TaxID=247481 RepID=A0A3N2QCL5_9BACT|nr:hypothetical protein EDM02_01975 [Candidatus Cardinium hertigii]
MKYIAKIFLFCKPIVAVYIAHICSSCAKQHAMMLPTQQPQQVVQSVAAGKDSHCCGNCPNLHKAAKKGILYD